MEEDYSLEELERLAQDRLHPSITNPNYLVLRRRAQLIGKWLGEVPGQDLRVLDIGGRYQPYRSLIRTRVAQYVAVDVVRTRLVNVIAKGEQLPFRSETFDVVIATRSLRILSRARRGRAADLQNSKTWRCAPDERGCGLSSCNRGRTLAVFARGLAIHTLGFFSGKHRAGSIQHRRFFQDE